MPEAATARRIEVGGRVQGVGFRPFVYRLATELGLAGWVRNEGGRVTIHVEGEPEAVAAFGRRLRLEAPPLARPEAPREVTASPEGAAVFAIEASTAEPTTPPRVPPDQALCRDCRAEIHDPTARRYRYPFTNCTACGPRYTIVDALPWDRANTAMADFPLCPACAAEYADPADRRHHAEALACPACGPRLAWEAEPGAEVTARHEAALAAAVAALRQGAIVAVRGVGGYHLFTDARDAEAIARLRTRKARPGKPLAVLFPATGTDDLDAVRTWLAPDVREADALRRPDRPIVLCRRRPDGLPEELAPGLDEIGALLPYSPLHELLTADFGGPLVATSANVSGEPVLTEPDAVRHRLADVADAFLHHDRPIRRPADDSVVRVIAGRPRCLRLGRGLGPAEIPLPQPLARPSLATGGHLKNAPALGIGQRALLAPHIGDQDAPRARDTLAAVATDLDRLYGIGIERRITDRHPDYGPHRWARDRGDDRPLVTVAHHHAHAAALAAEHPDVTGDWLIFTWDGTGLGPDDTLWGGEALLGRPGRWQRVASLRPFHLPGGERAGREPWRAAAALVWALGEDWDPPAAADPALVRAAWERGVNSPRSSSAGRLFDAAAALLGLATTTSWEGEAAMRLEALATTVGETGAPEPKLDRDADGILRADWAPLVAALRAIDVSAAQRAAAFHAGLAALITAQASAVAKRYAVTAVGLTGGVFQNRLLTESTIARLEAAGFDGRLTETIPGNDGGLALGQLVEAAARDAQGDEP